LPEFRDALPPEGFPLLLTCAKLPDRCHSQHQQAHRTGRGERLPLIMLHPDVAAERGIAEGEAVNVTSPYGTMRARAKLDANLDTGTVWAHYGWWQAVSGEAREMAANYAGLMGPASDPVSGSALLRGQYCQVAKVPSTLSFNE
jgi:anaerobic selenocysteine-containing dehydrogenase